MRAIVHIGLPKAGSTTIQSFLQANRTGLAAQGFHYRRMAARDVCQREYLSVVFRGMGQVFADPLQNAAAQTPDVAAATRRVAQLESWLEAQIAMRRDGVWLISNELLTARTMREDGLRALHDWLSARFGSVRYVLYLRRQDDWLLSAYSQRLRDGFDESLDAFAARVTSRNYLALVRMWDRIAGPAAVDVRLLDKDALAGGSLIDDYCAATGIAPAGLTRPVARNAGLSRRGARSLRRCNALIARAAPRRQGLASRMLRRAARTLAESPVMAGPPLALTAAQRAAIMTDCAATNDRLRQRRFPSRTSLFADRAQTAPIDSADALRPRLSSANSQCHTPAPK